ncbi:MAG: type VI secretion system tip protein TssI/VgrG [Massilia sp.]
MLEQLLTLPAAYSQASRLLRLTTPLGADKLQAESVRGEEAISEGFGFTISALSLDADISLRALLGQPALLELLTVDGAAPRAFHGHLTEVELNGANGGMARYTLTLRPWTAFMAHGRDSRVFQDMTVFDILDAVFGAWQGRARLAPAWRFEIADRALYPKRSLTTQYQESDLAFAERLMHEEGLFSFFEHAGDAASPGLGKHELVIADHNGAFQPNPQSTVRYTQPGAVMKEDSMDRWRSQMRLQTNAVELRSWDYRTLDTRQVAAAGVAPDGAALQSSDVPGQYAYASRSHGQRIADNQMQALEARREVFTGAGTVRTLSPGTSFTLTGQAVHDDGASEDERGFIVTRVVHLMHNNLNADLRADIIKRVGGGALADAIAAEQAGSLHAVGRDAGERPLYRNRIEAIRARVPYRASRVDGHGRLLHPKPTIVGQQSAIVVGPAGAVIHTDRDHRVKVQFHWQRGSDSHSRLAHPAPDGHTGAPADDSAGTWVRVAAPLAPVAGANWGSHALPRVGQEVLVDFLEGNIDRPVIIGALYNGAGAEDAQHNQVAQGAGAATGNAPAWFPGEAAEAHAHPAVLSGLKSQAMAASAQGSGAYSQLLFDDTPGQPRVALQRHAGAHQGTDELNLGHLRHQSDNARLQAVGFGAELKTEHGAALRAGKGILLSSDLRGGASGAQMDSREARTQIDASRELQIDLATAAQKHQAMLKDANGVAEPAPDKLAAITQLADSAETLAATNAGDSGGDAVQVTAYAAPHLQVSSPKGIAATTPANAVFAAGDSSSISAGQDINLAAQANSFASVKSGIGLFTYGKAASKDKPNQETGIALHAASGKVSTQSQADETRLTADKAITLASVTKSVTTAAKEHVMFAAQGATLKLEGGDIMLHGPGKIEFKAGMKELSGPQSASPTLPHLPKAGDLQNFLELNYRWDDQQPMEGAPYKVLFDNGASIAGKLDTHGFARLENVPAIGATVTFGEDEREAVLRKPFKPNAVAGAKPTTDEEAQAILAAYLAQEDAYYKDNYFPDEIEAMAAAIDADGERLLDYDFHYDDYTYADEESLDDHLAQKSYRELHDQDEDQA